MAQGTVQRDDLDAFYASAVQRDDPALRRRPVIVGGGVVLAASGDGVTGRSEDETG